MDAFTTSYLIDSRGNSRQPSRNNSVVGSPAESGSSTPNAQSGVNTPNAAIAPFAYQEKNKKGLWKSLKKAVVEHHRSVNAAYQVCYGQGLGVARN